MSPLARYRCEIEAVAHHHGIGYVVSGWLATDCSSQPLSIVLHAGGRPLRGSIQLRKRPDLHVEPGITSLGFEIPLARREAALLLHSQIGLAVGGPDGVATAERRLTPQRWAYEIETANGHAVTGWVADLMCPESPAMVLLRIGDRLVAVAATTERADAELAAGVHGRSFLVELPTAAEDGAAWAELCIGDPLNPVAALRLPGSAGRLPALARLSGIRARLQRDALAATEALRPKFTDLAVVPAAPWDVVAGGPLPRLRRTADGEVLVSAPSAQPSPALETVAASSPGTWSIANGLHTLPPDADGRGGLFPFLRPRPTARLLRQLPAAAPVLIAPASALADWAPVDGMAALVPLLLDRLGPPSLLQDVLYTLPSTPASAPETWRPEPPDPPPLVSLVVPSRDNLGHLAKLVAGVASLRRRHPELELVIVDNDSRSPTTSAFLDWAASDWIRVVRDHGGFNFSRLSNLGAQAARGSVLLFCNDDIEIGPDFDLARFVGHLAEPDVGIVGHTLLYEDGTIQHAGVVVGAYDAADNGQTAFTIDEGGYFRLARITREVSAVTGAFMAVRRGVFEQLGGFDERDFAISFNDVDLCLRAGRAGHTILNAWCGTIHHHESVSRGRLADRQATELAEVRNLRRIWDTANFEDPYYSPGFDRHALPYTRPLWRRIGLTPPRESS